MAFTKQQNMIIEHENGHALVGACPGSGKTTTMISLVLKLMEKGIAAEDILILTFGKGSQLDFEKRLKEKSEGASDLPAVRTFHSLGGLLCKALEERGFLKKATLEINSKRLEMTALNLIKSVVGAKEFKELQGDSKKIVEDFLSYADFIKSGFLSPKEVFELLGFGKGLSFFIKVFEKFEEQRKQKGLRYFSDLLYDPVLAIMGNEKLLNWFGNKKKYIIVDEYQDTNTIQHELIKIIAGTQAHVVAVGDIDQSIYSWRGSQTELMLYQFEQDFKSPAKYELTRTFRYGHRLALMANNLIVNNNERTDTLCISGRDDVITEVDFHGYRKDCGKEVVEIINGEIAKGRKLSDIAVLVRLYSSAAPVELELLRNGINYRLEGGYSCLNSGEMRNLEFILQIATGKHYDLDQETLEKSFSSLLKFPHVGLTTDAIETISKEMSKVGGKKEKVSTLLLRLRFKADKPYIQKKIAEHAYLFEEIEDMGSRSCKPGAILDHYVRESKLYKSMEQMALSALEVTEKKERCEVFLRYVKGLGSSVNETLNAFIDLREKQFSMEKDAESVLVTSIHKAKGLEWPVVIMPGLEGGRFPYVPSNDTALTTIESERRLFYVGITRAIEHLHLLAPRHSMYTDYLLTDKADVKDLMGDRDEPSQFIFELSPVCAEAFYSRIIAKTSISGDYPEHYHRYHAAIAAS